MRRRSESGFAMLFVLLMASLVAITLYMALPRFAFEAERDKEDTLIYRGEQYKRAIQLYVRQNKRWPAKVEDLEDTNGKRYLRKRYVDPMTGKDEWRAVHVGPNGVLTDSLVKPVKKDQGSDYSNNFITELGGVSGAPETPGAVNPGLRRRPSDQGPASDGSQSGGSLPGGNLPGGPPNGGQPSASGNPPTPPGGAQPGQPTSGQPGGGSPTSGTPASAPASGGISVFGGVGSTGPGYSTAPGANGTTPPPMQGALQGQTTGAPNGVPGTTSTPATAQQLIQGLLTSPRPGGAPGSTSGVGGVQGGGIAGFASKFEGEGIKIYNEQTEYKKWEFVYDMSKDPMITGGQQGIPQPAGQNGQTGQTTQQGQGGAFGAQTPTATQTSTTPGPTTIGH